MRIPRQLTVLVKSPRATRILRAALAGLWIYMGLGCKILDFAPRHREIVARILGSDHSLLFTRLIGIGEIGMAVWILSGIRSRWCVAAQIIAVLAMNAIELTVARDLLLFGAWNGLVALTFSAALFFWEFTLTSHPALVQGARA